MLSRLGPEPDGKLRIMEERRATSLLCDCYRKHLDRFLTRPGPFTDHETFMAGEQVIEYLSSLKVL